MSEIKHHPAANPFPMMTEVPPGEDPRFIAKAAKPKPAKVPRVKRQRTPAPVGTPKSGWQSIEHSAGQTDVANARRLISVHGDNFQYCHPWKKPLIWTGTRWQVDSNAAATRLAIDISDKLWIDAAHFRTNEAIQFAKESSKDGRLASMVKLAGSMRPVSVDELDANPWLLNCPNGTVDLRTGELRPHQREDNLTKLCPTNFNIDANSYHFDRFLESLFVNQILIDFMQRLCGYCLTGDVREQVLVVLFGGGSNGKSTFVNALLETVGIDYSSMAPPSLLMEKKSESHPTELASLFGQRLIVAQESNQGARLAEATVKQLTGGDAISARRMKEDFWTFQPTHKLILSTNHKPRVKGTDHAIWRRLALIPFTQKFWNPANGETGPPELMQDKFLAHKLAAEREGILAWMVRGCQEWQRTGLQIPSEVRLATAAYRSDSDTVGRFVADCCLVNQTNQTDRVKFAELFDALSAWCEEVGESIPPRKVASEWLRENGYGERHNNGLWFIGVALKANVSE